MRHRWLFLTTLDVMQTVPPHYIVPMHIEVCCNCFAVRGIDSNFEVVLIRAGVEPGHPEGKCID